MMLRTPRGPRLPTVAVDKAEHPSSCADCDGEIFVGDLTYTCEGKVRCRVCGRRHADEEVDHVGVL